MRGDPLALRILSHGGLVFERMLLLGSPHVVIKGGYTNAWRA